MSHYRNRFWWISILFIVYSRSIRFQKHVESKTLPTLPTKWFHLFQGLWFFTWHRWSFLWQILWSSVNSGFLVDSHVLNKNILHPWSSRKAHFSNTIRTDVENFRCLQKAYFLNNRKRYKLKTKTILFLFKMYCVFVWRLGVLSL